MELLIIFELMYMILYHLNSAFYTIIILYYIIIRVTARPLYLYNY